VCVIVTLRERKIERDRGGEREKEKEFISLAYKRK
jgi:hypothetical protein